MPQAFGFDIGGLTPAIVLFLLIPDQVQPRLFNEQVAPSLRQGCAIVIASGYNVFFKFLNVPSSCNVVMVAPRYVFISRQLCDLFLKSILHVG